jgi:hypothetical protein
LRRLFAGKDAYSRQRSTFCSFEIRLDFRLRIWQALRPMGYEEEGRALAYIGSLFFTAGLAAFAGAAFLFRKMLRSFRESQAEGWQVTSAQVTSGDVTVIHGRFLDYAIANVGYAYSICDAYYSGYLTRQFWDEQRAWTFADEYNNRQVMIKYNPGKPQKSVLRLGDQWHSGFSESIRYLARKKAFGPWFALLWSLRNVSHWAESNLRRHARNWPSAEASVEYAEPMIVGDGQDAHWVGDLRYTYSVDGAAYSGSHYFRVYDEDDAHEQVEKWRGQKLVVRYFRGNPAHSILIPEEQNTSLSASG